MARGHMARYHSKKTTEVSFLAPDPGAKFRIALLYPNTRRVGGANLGLAVLYRIINHLPGFAAERFFMPGPNERLSSQESGQPLNRFSLVMASLAFENDALNLLDMLRMAKMPLLSEERKDGPLFIMGGIVPMLNPEPLAPVADAFLLGEAEVVLEPFLQLWQETIAMPRQRQLRTFAQTLNFCYVPSLYHTGFDENGIPLPPEPLADGIPLKIKAPKYTGAASGLAGSMFMDPEVEMGNMYLQELGRGCGHGCRFCAAGHIYRPPRLGKAEDFRDHLLAQVGKNRKLGLVSASVNDIAGLDGLAREIVRAGGGFSVSSLRADTLSPALLEALFNCGQKTIALAPEAGSARLRQVINKRINEEQLLRAVEMAIDAGMLNLRLYFMIGLPHEDEADLVDLVDLVALLRERMLKCARAKGRLGHMLISLNPFLPKPFTPFQWQPMLSPKEISRRMAFIQKRLNPMANVKMVRESPRLSLLQAAISRGDRRLAPTLLGMGQDQAHPVKILERFALRERDFAEYLPWNIVDHGIKISYLEEQARLAEQNVLVSPCEPDYCRKCGICK